MPLISFLTTREDEMFTTAGTTFFTTAEYPRRDAASDLGEVFTVAAGFSGRGRVAALTPRKPVTAKAVVTATVASQRRFLKRLSDIFSCHLDFKIRPGGPAFPYGVVGRRRTFRRGVFVPLAGDVRSAARPV